MGDLDERENALFGGDPLSDTAADQSERESALFGPSDEIGDPLADLGDLSRQLDKTMGEGPLGSIGDLGFGGVDIPLGDEDAPSEEVKLTSSQGDVGAPGIGLGPLDGSHSVASYTQMLAPPSYEDSVMYDPRASNGSNGRGKDPMENVPVDLTPPAPGGGAAGAGATGSGAGGAGPSGSGSGSGSGARPAGGLRVTVGDPQAVPDETGSLKKTYTSYLVSGHSTLPGYPRRDFQARRRFRDFVELADLLAASHRGYFIPPRPDKSPNGGTLVGGTGGASFVEHRRLDLEKYLGQLAAHPVLSRAEELRTFLSYEGDLASAPAWRAAGGGGGGLATGVGRLPRQLFGGGAGATAEEAARPITGDLLRYFKEIKQTVFEGGGSASQDFEQLKVKSSIGTIDSSLTHLSKRAEDAVAAAEKLGAAAGDLGLVLIKAAKFQDAECVRRGQYSERGAPLRAHADDLSRVGEAAVRVSRLARAAAGQSAGALGEIHEYLAMMPSVKAALASKDEAALTAATLARELDSKRTKLAVAEAGGATRAAKAEECRREVAACEAAKEAAEEEHARMAERNHEELGRFRAAREADMSRMMASFARVEMAAAERMSALWSGVAEELGSPPPRD